MVAVFLYFLFNCYHLRTNAIVTVIYFINIVFLLIRKLSVLPIVCLVCAKADQTSESDKIINDIMKDYKKTSRPSEDPEDFNKGVKLRFRIVPLHIRVVREQILKIGNITRVEIIFYQIIIAYWSLVYHIIFLLYVICTRFWVKNCKIIHTYKFRLKKELCSKNLLEKGSHMPPPQYK